ncbi:glucagon [Platysternon megacephalum]|uniref:Glucagon n=1 Tax=Platysternon megacephalum TaxID=55544 RepID=A0A4D9FB32_9SAUR|nr:glucagon [Platysternon megacephalum]
MGCAPLRGGGGTEGCVGQRRGSGCQPWAVRGSGRLVLGQSVSPIHSPGQRKAWAVSSECVGLGCGQSQFQVAWCSGSQPRAGWDLGGQPQPWVVQGSGE